VAVATKDRSECPERAHDHASNSGRSAASGEALISLAICLSSSSLMLLGMLEILKVRGVARAFFGRLAALHTISELVTVNTNTSDRITATTAMLSTNSISGIFGNLFLGWTGGDVDGAGSPCKADDRSKTKATSTDKTGMGGPDYCSVKFPHPIGQKNHLRQIARAPLVYRSQ
jgi:hypothetical protein